MPTNCFDEVFCVSRYEGNEEMQFQNGIATLDRLRTQPCRYLRKPAQLLVFGRVSRFSVIPVTTNFHHAMIFVEFFGIGIRLEGLLLGDKKAIIHGFV
jgi:hypothetical protein